MASELQDIAGDAAAVTTGEQTAAVSADNAPAIELVALMEDEKKHVQSDQAEEDDAGPVSTGDDPTSTEENDSQKQVDNETIATGDAETENTENTPSGDISHEGIGESKLQSDTNSQDDQREESQEASGAEKKAEQHGVFFADPHEGKETKEEGQTSLQDDVEPKPPVSILKKESSYVVAEKDDAVGTSLAQHAGKHRKGEEGKKSVYIWQLFRYADFWDTLMILVGVVMAIISGVALPGHMLLFGQVINQFVYYTSAANITSSSFSSNQSSCEATVSFIINDRQLLANISQGASSHFCSASSSGVDVIVGILGYVCDPAGTLFREVGLYSIYYVALATGVLIVTFLATVVWNISAYRQSRRMRLAFFRSILRQDIGWFDVKGVSELSTRLADDVEKVQAGIGDKISAFLQSISTFVAGYVIGFITNWKLALVIAALLPVLAFMAAFIAKIIATFTVREQAAYAAAGGVAEEVLSSIRTVVAFGGEQKETERYGEKLKLARNEGYRKGFFSSLVVGGLYFVIFCTYALGFWYGSTLIISCELAAGDVITVFFAVIIGSFSLGNALPEIETFATALGAASVLFAIIDREPEIDWTSDEGETPDHLEGNIKFSDVVFSYPARPDIQILNGIDLEIKKGQTVAFVGPSGCGKSTTIQLLQRFYNPLAGQITLDGREIRTLNLRWLRSHIGVVSQEPVLFNTTIAENIRYGREDATMEDIIQAAMNANAHDFISKLPDGYDTDVGERGAQLSGGQKQRIAIARALVRNPKILLLDEATSALDNESERIVQQALDKAREGRTTIVIAHRLSTIRTANMIVALSRGRVVELGTHEQLMEQKGLYHELVTAQTIDEDKEKREPLSEFREAVRRTISMRKQTITSRSISEFQRKSITSQLSKSSEKKPSLSDIPSRFSIADIPIGGALGAFSGRSTFPGPVDVLEHAEEESVFETEQTAPEEVGAGEPRRKRSMLGRKPTNVPEVSFLQLLKLNKPDWILVVIGVFFSAVIGCLFPVISVLFSEMLRIFGLTDPQEIKDGTARLAGGFVGVAAGSALIYFIANITLSIAGERLTKRLRYLSFKAILRQEIGWFDKKVNSTGALTTRLASDASDVKGATGIRLGTILQAAVGFVAAIIVAFTGSWQLTLVLILAFPILGVASFFQVRLLSGRAQKNKKRLEEAGQVAVESVDNIRSVAGLGLEHRFSSKYDQLLKGPFKNNIKSVFVQAAVIALGESLVFYIYAAGYIFGAYLVKENMAAYEDIFLVFGAIVFTAMSIGRATSFAPDASKAQTSAARILTLIHREPPIDTSSGEGLKMEDAQCKGDISATDVHFHYPTRPEVKILQGLTVSVKPGQTLALVGPSGCGKSTIVSLVERFYDPVNGNVTLEGTDLRDLNLSWLRRQIGIVSQEPVLFDASIADNIRYGALYREVSDQEVIEAAKSANIHSFIESLPQGYSTNVGAKGTQLSGGQKQRIAIARAMVRDPKILLLDEATSALDTESEKIVQEALDKARKGRTSIAIAHRLSTIYNSDVIAVIHDGQVFESGTHSQLMAKKGAYFHLNTAQFDENTD